MAAPDAPDIDLQDPAQLAALLCAALPEDEWSSDDLPEQVQTLVESDSLVFSHVGAATSPGDDTKGSSDQAGVDATAGDMPDASLDDAPPPAPDPSAGEGPDDEVMADGADDVMPETLGTARTGSPLRSGNKPWYDWDRRRSKDKYPLYKLAAVHSRREPITSKFTGECQAVRVRLPATPVAKDSYVGTFFGKVEAGDHLLFSIQQVRDHYASVTGRTVALERVDLITGARHLGRRFSPVSIYFAYTSDADDALPCFYILEGGSASGQPKALYVGKDMDTQILQQAGFSFTPLTCKQNWYKGGVEMKTDMRHPARVFLTSSQERDGKFDYIDLSVTYTIIKDPRRVIAPFELQVEAAMRVLAIAEQMGCELRSGGGGGLQPVLGPIAEATIPWDIKPRGSTNAAERARYCGCPKSGATTVDPTPPSPTPPSPTPPIPTQTVPRPTDAPPKPERGRPSSSTEAAERKPPARKPKPPT
jgi:hypothetical protein